jgi:hypothetical protein
MAVSRVVVVVVVSASFVAQEVKVVMAMTETTEVSMINFFIS